MSTISRSQKIAAVEEEFDEPFADVVRGFAEMGYSRRATAQILEFNLSYFRMLLVRYDLDRYFLPQSKQRPECRGVGTSRGLGVKHNYSRAPKYSDEYLLRCVAASSSRFDFHARFMIDPQTVQHRFGSWERAKSIATQEGSWSRLVFSMG